MAKWFWLWVCISFFGYGLVTGICYRIGSYG